MRGVFLIGITVIAGAIVFIFMQLPESLQPAIGTTLLVVLPLAYIAERGLGKVCAFKAIKAQSQPRPAPERPARAERRRATTRNVKSTARAGNAGRVTVR